MNDELINMELFDFEQFKEEAQFKDGNVVLGFRTAEEQWAFKKYLAQNNILKSGFGLLEVDVGNVGVTWHSFAKSVWGLAYREAAIQGSEIVYLDYFCSKPFTSSEDELVKFLK